MTINVFGGGGFSDYFVAAGIWSADQVDPSYDGSPARFIAEGNIGLIEAAKRFDPGKKVKFITYAVWWVRQAIIHALSDQSGAFSLPQKQANLLYRIGRRWGPPGAQGVRRGVVILQVDGLSSRALVKALRQGRVPMLSALLARGTHRLHRWHCGIPSNTPAVQAGFLYGNRQNVAGYRWFDRVTSLRYRTGPSAKTRESRLR